MQVSQSQTLMSIAKNSNLRVHERIKEIKGEDKKISSPEEAKAILAIPASDLTITDNKQALSIAKMDANYYLSDYKARKNKENKIKDNNSTFEFISNAYKEYKKLQKTINNINKLIKGDFHPLNLSL